MPVQAKKTYTGTTTLASKFSSHMKTYTGTTTLASKFSSHMIGLQLHKMKMYVLNFMGAYIEDHGKIPLKAQTSVPKSQFFPAGDQSYESLKV